MKAGILCPKHASVDFIDGLCLKKWIGQVYVKRGIDQYQNSNDAIVVTLEQFNYLLRQGL